MPKPAPVDIARVTKGSLSVTVNEDGKTRLRDRYLISSPLAGHLQRIKLRAGDPVFASSARERANHTTAATELGGAAISTGSSATDSSAAATVSELAVIDPVDPVLLDSRQIAQAELRVKSSESAIKSAGAARQKAAVNLEWARTDVERRKGLTGKGAGSKQELEDAEMLVRSRTEELNAAKFAEEIARFELDLSRAALLRSRPLAADETEKWLLRIQSPINGVVLKVLQESETVVQVGTPLLEVGDPRDLEIDVEVLSTDAVKIRPGQTMWLKHWGGDRPLSAQVRLVEPQGFLKLSALGVEEQRVHVIAQFTEPLESRKSLGDGYRVEAEIVVWEEDNVIKVPTGALFREPNTTDPANWSVFVLEAEQARKRRIKIGRRNGLEAEVIEGLREADTVIVHPSDRIVDQIAVKPR
jgi:HlyD family secretion protein